MLCQDVRKRMRAYIGATLTAAERKDFENHVKACPSCRAEVERAGQEDSSGLVDILELAASEKSQRPGTGRQNTLSGTGRTPVGGTKPVGDTGRRSVITRVPTPANGVSALPPRNGASIRASTPPTDAPAVTFPSKPQIPVAARKSPLPFVVAGLVVVVGGAAALVLTRGDKPQPAPAPPAHASKLPPAPDKPAVAPIAKADLPPVEAPPPAEAKPEEVRPEKAEGKPAKPRAEIKAEPRAEAKAEAKVEPKADKAADPLAAKPAKAAEVKDDKPKTQEAALASDAVKGEKKGAKDELSDVLAGNAAKKDKEEAAAKPDDSVPAKLSQADLQKGMRPVQAAAAACYEKHQQPGTVNVKLTIDAGGSVSSAAVTGSFAGTPTGSCVLDAAKKATFPKTKSQLTFSYPFMLR